MTKQTAKATAGEREYPKMRDDTCAVCGCELEDDSETFGIAMWEGEVVANEDEGEWGGSTCCRDCYEKHERGLLPTRPVRRKPRRLVDWGDPSGGAK